MAELNPLNREPEVERPEVRIDRLNAAELPTFECLEQAAEIDSPYEKAEVIKLFNDLLEVHSNHTVYNTIQSGTSLPDGSVFFKYSDPPKIHFLQHPTSFSKVDKRMNPFLLYNHESGCLYGMRHYMVSVLEEPRHDGSRFYFTDTNAVVWDKQNYKNVLIFKVQLAAQHGPITWAMSPEGDLFTAPSQIFIPINQLRLEGYRTTTSSTDWPFFELFPFKQNKIDNLRACFLREVGPLLKAYVHNSKALEGYHSDDETREIHALARRCIVNYQLASSKYAATTGKLSEEYLRGDDTVSERPKHLLQALYFKFIQSLYYSNETWGVEFGTGEQLFEGSKKLLPIQATHRMTFRTVAIPYQDKFIEIQKLEFGYLKPDCIKILIKESGKCENIQSDHKIPHYIPLDELRASLECFDRLCCEFNNERHVLLPKIRGPCSEIAFSKENKFDIAKAIAKIVATNFLETAIPAAISIQLFGGFIAECLLGTEPAGKISAAFGLGAVCLSGLFVGAAKDSHNSSLKQFFSRFPITCCSIAASIVSLASTWTFNGDWNKIFNRFFSGHWF